MSLSRDLKLKEQEQLTEEKFAEKWGIFSVEPTIEDFPLWKWMEENFPQFVAEENFSRMSAEIGKKLGLIEIKEDKERIQTQVYTKSLREKKSSEKITDKTPTIIVEGKTFILENKSYDELMNLKDQLSVFTSANLSRYFLYLLLLSKNKNIEEKTIDALFEQFARISFYTNEINNFFKIAFERSKIISDREKREENFVSTFYQHLSVFLYSHSKSKPDENFKNILTKNYRTIEILNDSFTDVNLPSNFLTEDNFVFHLDGKMVFSYPLEGSEKAVIREGGNNTDAIKRIKEHFQSSKKEIEQQQPVKIAVAQSPSSPREKTFSPQQIAIPTISAAHKKPGFLARNFGKIVLGSLFVLGAAAIVIATWGAAAPAVAGVGGLVVGFFTASAPAWVPAVVGGVGLAVGSIIVGGLAGAIAGKVMEITETKPKETLPDIIPEHEQPSPTTPKQTRPISSTQSNEKPTRIEEHNIPADKFPRPSSPSHNPAALLHPHQPPEANPKEEEKEEEKKKFE